MTLDQLRYFCAVCTYNSVTLAAQILNISQPSVSTAIRNLESEFGVSLFDRQRKRLVLTSAGQQLWDMGKPLLHNADALTQAMHALSSGNQFLRLGVPPMIGSLVLPPLYSNFVSGQLQLQVVEDGSSSLRRFLRDGQIDMALLPHTQPFDDTLQAVKLTVLQNVCCVSKQHPLAACSHISLAQLKNEPLVLFKNSFFQTERILNAFQASGISPNVALYTGQLSTVQNMIAGGSAVGFMFEFLAKRSDCVIGIPLDPPMTTQVSLVWRKDKALSCAMEALVHLVETQTIDT